MAMPTVAMAITVATPSIGTHIGLVLLDCRIFMDLVDASRALVLCATLPLIVREL
jgi:hypothetical protein